MELKELYASKRYVQDGALMDLPSPSQLVEPFVGVFGGVPEEAVHIQTGSRVVNENEDKSENISFGRVSVEIDMFHGQSIVDRGMDFRVGMVYALDVRKPQVRVYARPRVRACLNLTIFNANHVTTFDLLGGTQGEIVRKARELMDDAEGIRKGLVETVDRLQGVVLPWPSVHRILGSLLVNHVGFGTTPVVNAARLIADSKSKYYLEPANDSAGLSGWKLYNALTEGVGNGQIFEEPTKTLHLSQRFLSVLSLN